MVAAGEKQVASSTAAIIRPARQKSAPNPGPTLSIRLTKRLRRKHPVRFAAKIEIARDLD